MGLGVEVQATANERTIVYPKPIDHEDHEGGGRETESRLADLYFSVRLNCNFLGF